MIVDFHTHTFPERIAAAAVDKLRSMSHTRPFSDGTVSGLRRSMEQAGVDLSVVLPVATNTHQVAKVNDASAQLNSEPGVISFGCIHPELEEWEAELERAAQLGLPGVKLHPVYQNVDIDDEQNVRILTRCGQLGLIVLTHAGLDVGFPGQVNCSPSMTRRALDRAGDVTVVLAHMGGWRNWDQVAEYLADTEVYLDTSFSLGCMTADEGVQMCDDELALMGQEQFMELVRTFGSKRILFGSDSPWGGQEQTLAALRALPLTDTEKIDIFSGNACRLLGLRAEEELV